MSAYGYEQTDDSGNSTSSPSSLGPLRSLEPAPEPAAGVGFDDEDEDANGDARVITAVPQVQKPKSPPAAMIHSGSSLSSIGERSSSGRGRCCGRCCCPNFGTFSTLAEPEELLNLFTALRPGELVLARNVVCGGEQVEAKSTLVAAGRCYPKIRQDLMWWEVNDVREYVKQHIDEDRSLRVSFKVSQAPYPWCIILRCPCCVYLFVMLCLALLLLAGIAVGGDSLQLNTNFDSFTESDGDQSEIYNALATAVGDFARGEQRRLFVRDKETPLPDDRTWADKLKGVLYSSAFAWHRFRNGFPGAADRRLREFGPTEDDPVRGTPLYNVYQIDITYVAVNDSVNILSPGAMREIHSIEQRLKHIPEYKNMCDKPRMDPTAADLCLTGTSFANVAFAAREPQEDGGTALVFNGTGTQMLPLQVAAEFARQGGVGELTMPNEALHARVLLIDDERCTDKVKECAQLAAQGYCRPFSLYQPYMKDVCSKTCRYCGSGGQADLGTEVQGSVSSGTRIIALRSHFTFKKLCCYSGDSNRSEAMEISKAEYGTFVDAVLQLEEELRQEPYPLVNAYFQGGDFDTKAVMNTVMDDLVWGVMSYCFVSFYATLHTRSLFLSTVGLQLVLLSIPSAMSIFMIVSGGSEISLMMLLSVFIVIGVGSDMLFVYTDFWKQSVQYSRDPMQRLKFTYKQASTSTAATTFTTCMSFLANLASSLRPLREFGFFMGACVLMAWLLMFITYPPMLVVGERLHRQARTAIKQRTSQDDFEFQDDEEDDFDMSIGRRKSLQERVSRTKHKWTRKSQVVMASMLDPEKKGVGTFHQTFLGSGLALCISRHRYSVIIVSLFITFLEGWIAVEKFELESDVPKVYPDDHPREQMKQYTDMFMPYTIEDARGTNLAVVRCGDIFKNCQMQECTTGGNAVGTDQVCQCFSYKEPQGACTPKQVKLALVGRTELEAREYSASNYLAYLKQTYPDLDIAIANIYDVNLRHMVTLHWESGEEDVARILLLPTASINNKSTPEWCEYPAQHVCYCGVARCRTTTSTFYSASLGSVQLNDSGDDMYLYDEMNMTGMDTSMGGRLLHDSIGLVSTDGKDLQDSFALISRYRREAQVNLFTPGFGARRLQDDNPRLVATVRPGLQSDVVIFWGIEKVGNYPLLGVMKDQPYNITGEFDLADPWAQRTALKMCTEWPDNMKVARQICWIMGFKDWWEAKGEEYPVRIFKNLHAQAYEFATTVRTVTRSTTDFVRFDEDQRVVAMYYQVFLDMAKTAPSHQATELYNIWNEYFTQFNLQAKGTSYEGVLHGSRLWVAARAQSIIVRSTTVTLLIALGCVVLGVCVFTGSFHLAIIVMTLVMATIVSLGFFMVVIMGLKVGPIEILSLIVFVGFAVDYCLHVAHKYHSCHVQGIHEEEEDEDDEEFAASLSTVGQHGSTNSTRVPSDSRFEWKDASRTGSRSASRSGSFTRSGSRKRDSRRVSITISETLDQPDSAANVKPVLSASMQRLLQLNRPEERFERTKYALERMGSAVIGSALTTIGCAVFLLPCTIVIFTKIGSVVLAVTSYAIIYTMLPLPAVLMIMGPCQKDLQQVLDFVMRTVMYMKRWWLGEEMEEELTGASAARRYVLNMPARCMSAAPHAHQDAQAPYQPSRSKIIATGGNPEKY